MDPLIADSAISFERDFGIKEIIASRSHKAEFKRKMAPIKAKKAKKVTNMEHVYHLPKYVTPVDLAVAIEWSQGLHRVLSQIKCESGIGDNIQSSEFGDQYFCNWDWIFTNAADIILINSEKKLDVLSYITDVEPGVRILLTCFCDNNKAFLGWYFKIFIILRECVNPKNKKTQASTIKQVLDCPYISCCIHMMGLITSNLTESDDISKAPQSAGASPSFFQDVLSNIFWFLAAVVQRDPNFANTLSDMSKVKFVFKTMKLLFFHKSTSFYPTLRILRKLSRNHKVSILLGKNRVMHTMKKIFGFFNNQPSSKLQMVFDILVNLTKEKGNCRRFLQAGCLIAVINCFQNWTSWKGRGLMKMCKSVLAIYSHLAMITSGKKALRQSAALTHIKKFCECCPSGKGFDDIMMKACAMLTLCYNVHKLPLHSTLSPAHFHVQKENVNDDDDSGTSSDEDNPDDPDLGVSDNDDDLEYLDDFSDGDYKNGSENEEEYGGRGYSAYNDTRRSRGRNSSPQTLSKYVAALKKNLQQSVSRSDSAKLRSPGEKKKASPTNTYKEYSQFFSEFDIKDHAKFGEHKPIDGIAYFNIPLESRPQASNSLDVASKSVQSDKKLDSFYLGKMESTRELRVAYVKLGNRTRSVIPFVKLAYPDWTLAGSALKTESLLPPADRSTLRNKVLTEMSRASGTDTFKAKVVFDLDDLLANFPANTPASNLKKKATKAPLHISNNDEREIGMYNKKLPLIFESRFESGNLRKVIQIGTREFNLVLTSDVNSNGHSQWFYFQISNTLEDVVYTFNIINCIKGNSQFNFGMQPVVFSVSEAMSGNPGWVRSGFNICYYRNCFRNVSGKKRKAYYTASFSLTFSKRGDIVYVAYHIPYPYTRLLVDLEKKFKRASKQQSSGRIIRCDTLCQSLNQNDVPIITVTGPNTKKFPVIERDVIILTARVHPGETNASWVMLGILNKLILSSSIENILKYYIFKVVPMLNVEGVINGCHRCGLTAEDLNRRWKSPTKSVHPTIYNTKMIIEYCCKVEKKVPVLFCDLHGHSRKKNVFLYGCSRNKSWLIDDHSVPESMQMIEALPVAISKSAPAVSIESCIYDVKKSRETTARVTFWRDFNIKRSYTLECSYCGCDRGTYKGLCLGTKHLVEVGEALIEGVDDITISPQEFRYNLP